MPPLRWSRSCTGSRRVRWPPRRGRGRPAGAGARRAPGPPPLDPLPFRFSTADEPGDPEPERPIIPKESTLESIDLAQPQIHGYKPNPTDPDNPYPAGLGTICDELYQAAAGNPRSPDKPLPVPPELWKIIGIKNSHNGKLGTEADFKADLKSYLRGTFPTNEIKGSATVAVKTDGAAFTGTVGGPAGWRYFASIETSVPEPHRETVEIASRQRFQPARTIAV